MKNKNRAFSLIELSIVVLIIGILIFLKKNNNEKVILHN